MKNNQNTTEGINVVRQDSLDKFIGDAIDNNDTIAYNKVSSYYLLNNMGKDFFLTALVMANKNQSAEACFHVYDIIAYSTPKEPKDALEKLDAKTRFFALYYLLKSYEMGYESAKYQVEEIFGKGKIIPKSSYYLHERIKVE